MNAIPAHFQSMSMRPRHAVDVAAIPICATPGSFGERARSRFRKGRLLLLLWKQLRQTREEP